MLARIVAFFAIIAVIHVSVAENIVSVAGNLVRRAEICLSVAISR